MTGEQEGTLFSGVGGIYRVRDADGQTYTLRARGRFRRDGQTPLCGDRVLFTPGVGEEHGWLYKILERTSVLTRPPAANVSLLVVVVAPEPVPDLLLVDRLLIQAQLLGIATILVCNKCDLDIDLAMRLFDEYQHAGIACLAVSAEQGTGLDALRAFMQGQLSCMAGQSAVGKSTLLNALCGLSLVTGGLSERIQRGKHTTRHTELLTADGLTVLDTPGFSLLELASCEPVRLKDAIPEFAQYEGQCRFQPCLHDTEPGCAVRDAVQASVLNATRYARYKQLLLEVREAWKGRWG